MEGAFLAEDMARSKTLSTRVSGMCGWSQENPAVSGEQSTRVGSGIGQGCEGLGPTLCNGSQELDMG